MMLIDVVLLALVIIAGIAAIEARNLFAAIGLASAYSLLLACFWTTMDAVDVAYTEAAVGAGISTIMLIGAIVLTGEREIVRRAVHWPALLACAGVAVLLVYGTLDMPRFGDPDAPAHTHPIYAGFTQQDVMKDPSGKSFELAQEYAAAHPDHSGDYFHGHVPNQVTSVIVSYRAFDTLFEVAVIFTAAMALVVLLRGRRGNPLKGGLL
ncbi:MAG: DUF4040 domain-containing protein [Planctomycetes bacterium]|nr:DUF4040 domain-containing protein [Planctomycetota bacterium]MCW8136448.1 DUF4040 domain-containing protein [Planctomycetota bacterium]